MPAVLFFAKFSPVLGPKPFKQGKEDKRGRAYPRKICRRKVKTEQKNGEKARKTKRGRQSAACSARAGGAGLNGHVPDCPRSFRLIISVSILFAEGQESGFR